MTASAMKYYSVDIQVDFDVPREVSPAMWSGKPFPAVGYFQYFYCTERSKERAKAVALEFVRNHEEYPDRCRIKCDRIAWMNLVRRREDLAIGAAVGLTDEMFAARDRIGIWWQGERGYYVSERDAAIACEEADRVTSESIEDRRAGRPNRAKHLTRKKTRASDG